MTYHQKIFKNMPFPCLLFERREGDFVIKESNTQFCKITNSNEEELKGKLIEEVFPQNSFSLGSNEIVESFKIAFTSQEPHKIDVLRYDIYDKQNDSYQDKYWEIENIPLLDENHESEYILNVVRDITFDVLESERCNVLQYNFDTKTENHEEFIERITDGLFSLDLEGNFVSLNKGLIDIVETPESELLKMNFLPFCGQDHREIIVKKFNVAIGGKNQKFEANFISGKGRKMFLEISLVPLKNEGKITGLYGIAKDISRLKESENALSQSEIKFKSLVQEGSDLIGILDLEGKYKFVSETSYPVLGFAPEEFIGKMAFDFIHPEDKERVIKQFSELELKRQIEIQPFRFKNAKGEWRWIETKATNFANDPSVSGIVTNSRDVTEHINSQKAIKESEERYRSFFENSIDAVMVTIPDGRILAANPSACKMFQRTEKELCLMGRAAVTDPMDPRLAEALKLRRETGTASLELSFIRKDGSKFPGEITSSIFKDANGDLRSSMIIRDITERKATENNLLKLNKELKNYTKEILTANEGLEQFSYIVSHNLRAPIANIIGLANLLENNDQPEEIQKELFNETFTNIRRLDNVMQDLNETLKLKDDFSKKRESVNLESLTQSIIASNQNLIDTENVSITNNFGAIDKVYTVKSYLYSTFFNLISNSIKYRKPDVSPVIEIRTERLDDQVIIHFKDNGLGIDLEKKGDQIFGFYKRFHKHVEGRGLGLFMVKSQLVMLGGQIEVKSLLGHGTEFTIYLPNNK
ncbi:PAS domain-containing sensor histidine kinase [Gillisia sp. JM1]|uniref:PAS domain-containing protein n=1 Tax=Gillisia sp. JM1 TaxID=1283286 RepID=UPI000407AE74|nr:PAS domain-containing sensor histidine kinase [Gillisia sp. JM1]